MVAIVDGAKRGSSGRVMNAAKHSGFRTSGAGHNRKAGVINATMSQISACVAKGGQT
jgi:hypothetical protein